MVDKKEKKLRKSKAKNGEKSFNGCDVGRAKNHA